MLDEYFLEGAIELNEVAKVGRRCGCQSAPGHVQIAYSRVEEFFSDNFHATVVKVAMGEAKPLHEVVRLANVHDGVSHASLVQWTHGLVTIGGFVLVESCIFELRVSVIEIINAQIILAKANSFEGCACFERSRQSLHNIVL